MNPSPAHVAGLLVWGWLVKHALFALAVAVFVVTLGQNWAHYSAALMIAAWVRYDGRLRAPL